jgi:dienelactone hydrolase
MAKAMDFPPHLEALAGVVQAANVRFKDVNSWGGIGLCWGGKVVALLSGPGSIFSVSGQVHPGRLAREDAEKISIPHIVLASNGEDAKVVEEYKEILEGREEGKARGVVETYGTMHHGWMGARAKLGEEENLKEYERGYNQLAGFFGKHLQ